MSDDMLSKTLVTVLGWSLGCNKMLFPYMKDYFIDSVGCCFSTRICFLKYFSKPCHIYMVLSYSFYSFCCDLCTDAYNFIKLAKFKRILEIKGFATFKPIDISLLESIDFKNDVSIFQTKEKNMIVIEE